jgi:hypothetical protein
MSNILSILKSVFWLVVNFFKWKNNPQRQYDNAKQENARIIVNGDQDALNRKLNNLTDQLPKSNADGEG